MIEAALIFAFGCFGLGLLFNLWRIATGPDSADRILALDTMVINIIALLILVETSEQLFDGTDYVTAVLGQGEES